MKLAAEHALADSVTEVSPDKIIPGAFETNTAELISDAVKKCEKNNC